MKNYIHTFFILLGLGGIITPAIATTRASDYVSANTYNNMYPYMNNRMRTNLNPGINTGAAPAQVTTMTRTIKPAGTTERRVVSRPTPARQASASGNTIARSGTAQTATVANTQTRGVGTSSPIHNQSSRRVVPRATRTDASVTRNAYKDANKITSDAPAISSTRCLADYTECMNGYCERENTEYNRCYCSAKLSQIDSKYQPAIDSLIKQILTIRNNNYWTQAEMDEYWMDVVGKYSGTNSWTNLEDALNIDWSNTDSRLRGQQAFNTGHEYCVQHLRACAYMASNLRDVYRSEISRDCAAYESSLQRLQNVAESVVESYK